jgi:aspartate dehydrogenase
VAQYALTTDLICDMKIAIIGGGTIARLFLEHIGRGELGEARVVTIVGRGEQSRGRALAGQFAIPYTTSLQGILEARPHAVIEAASHEAVRTYGEPLLARGIAVIVLSGGALCDDALRARLEGAARDGNALLYVPSGGIGGLDALKAACMAGVDEVTIAVTKPPAAWQGIPYVEKLGVNLDTLDSARTLFDGSAREGVPHFPANVNIAAVLSMAGIGFDRTRLRVVADPALNYNTHYITIVGKSGNISLKLENVPAPENPKTAWLACYSALAALKQMMSPVRYGT